LESVPTPELTVKTIVPPDSGEPLLTSWAVIGMSADAPTGNQSRGFTEAISKEDATALKVV
jgi:hypothetical protein